MTFLFVYVPSNLPPFEWAFMLMSFKLCFGTSMCNDMVTSNAAHSLWVYLTPYKNSATQNNSGNECHQTLGVCIRVVHNRGANPHPVNCVCFIPQHKHVLKLITKWRTMKQKFAIDSKRWNIGDEMYHQCSKIYCTCVPQGDSSTQETQQLQFGAAENVKCIQNRVETHTAYNEGTHTYIQSEKAFTGCHTRQVTQNTRKIYHSDRQQNYWFDSFEVKTDEIASSFMVFP
jgi:hypothetical protein